MEKQRVINKKDRSIKEKFTVGNYRVILSTSYSNITKTYTSSLKEARLDYRDNGFYFEVSQLHLGFASQREGDDFYRIICRVSNKLLTELGQSDRYSFKQLEKCHEGALLLAEDDIQNLLKKGKTNSEIYGEVA